MRSVEAISDKNVKWEEGRREGMEDGKDGRMEGWKDGRLEGWKIGRMEGWFRRRRGTGRPPGWEKSKLGTARTCPPKPWRRRRQSLPEKRHWLGGLQSLAAAGAEHCPIGLGGAERPAPSRS